MKLVQFVQVFVGAGFGGVLRFAIGTRLAERWGAAFPWHTFAINVAGSFLLGLLFALSGERGWLPESSRVYLGVGLLGGFTTFSTYSLEGVTLFERGLTLTGLAYVVGSVVVGLAAAWAGLAMGRAL